MEDNSMENKWREKLNSVPPPQRNEAWNSMEVLLDEHLPVKRNSWLYLTILLLLSLLVFFVCNRQTLNNKLVNKDGGNTNKELPLNTEEQKMATINKPKNKLTVKIKQNSIEGTKGGVKSTTSKTKNNAIDKRSEKLVIETRLIKESTASKISNDAPVENKVNIIKGNKYEKEKRKNRLANRLITVPPMRNRTAKFNGSSVVQFTNRKASSDKDTNKLLNSATETTKEFPIPPNEIKLNQLPSLASDTLNSLGESTKSKLTNLLVNRDTVLKEYKSDSSKKEQVKRDKHKWAFGTGFNYFFPVDAQQISTNNNWREFLPILQTKYFLNNKTSLQAELQWYSPQYTKEHLVHRHDSVITSGPGTASVRRAEESIFVRKLFYIDIPVSVHVNPIKNLSVGGGIQYSRLIQAIGLHETKIIALGRPDSIVSTNTNSIERNLMKETFKMGETRFLFDVAVKVNRFNIGLQYNQAFRSYIKNAIPGSSIPSPKNKSLHVFLRYRIKGSRN